MCPLWEHTLCTLCYIILCISALDDFFAHISGEVKVSRAAKRRAKKADVAQQRESELQHEREYQFMHSPRAVEQRIMFTLIKEKGLTITEISADGDWCVSVTVDHRMSL